MRTLELFSGTQSFSKAVLRDCSTNEAITVDILPKFAPTHVANILEWDYKHYPPGYFDIIWASPPCTEYSKAKTRGVRDLSGADMLVKKTFEIIDYYNPRVWIVENVGTGLLVSRMSSIRDVPPPTMVDYCSYGKPYRKRTALWSEHPLNLKLCGGPGVCSQMEDNKHKGSCGNGTKKYNSANIHSVWEKDSIPDLLMDSILEQIKL